MAELMSAAYVDKLVGDLAGNPKIYWKTAVMKLLLDAREGGKKRAPTKRAPTKRAPAKRKTEKRDEEHHLT